MLDRKEFIDAAAKVKDLDQLKNDSFVFRLHSHFFFFLFSDPPYSFDC